MVTFVCSYCDTTLKKKQAEKHAFGRCRPASFICIDCHVTFNGNDFKNHISCLTEFEKHWGEYAKPKQNTPKPNSQYLQQQSQAVNAVKPKVSPKAQQQEPVPAKKQKAEVNKQQPSQQWRGWKNQLKSLIKQSSNKIQLSDLQERALKRYRALSEDDLQDQQIKQIIKEKVSKLKKVKVVTYVTLE